MELDAEKYYTLRRRIKFILKSMGFRLDVDDCLHTYFVKLLEGKCKKQKLDFFVIDYVRSITKSRSKSQQGHRREALGMHEHISVSSHRRLL